MATAPGLTDAQRIVVKIGSALVVDADQAAPRAAWLASVAADIAWLRADGREVIVVSSGAIALARRTLGLIQPRLRLEEKQAAAAVGQIRLAQAWSAALSAERITAAQLLLTLDDTEDRRRYLNARATINTLLSLGAVPVINENDSVATVEIRFGDNDRLAARVAEMVQADQLILLSDIDGLYTADPRRDPAAQHLPVVNENDSVATAEIRFGDNDRLAARVAEMVQADQLILFSDIDGLYSADPRGAPDAAHLPLVARLTPEIEAMGGEPPPGYSSGGMRTKLLAARIATRAGTAMAIALGHQERPLSALVAGARCTWFLPAPEARSARKNWIAGSLQPAGSFTVDAGAARALASGGSLLPAGVRQVSGSFGQGDAVLVLGPAGERLGQGLSAYDAADALRLAGHRSDAFEAILGWRGSDELIHRDDLVLF